VEIKVQVVDAVSGTRDRSSKLSTYTILRSIGRAERLAIDFNKAKGDQ
jgi:hypothetical protein